MAIKFEWDIEKASFNYQKHGVTFQEAKTIWDNKFAAFVDDPNHLKR